MFKPERHASDSVTRYVIVADSEQRAMAFMSCELHTSAKMMNQEAALCY